MDDLIRKLVECLPLDFRVLFRQFFLRVIDLEALSIEADVERFLGQFAGVTIMLSLVHSVVLYVGTIVFVKPAERLAFFWHMEHYLIATMMLVVGLFTVISWDAAFPDRRDVMVLSPLPIASRTILLAKITASASIIGVAILTLNCACGLLLPFLLDGQAGPRFGFFQALPAWGFTLLAASVFLYGSVLTAQGLTALILPRRIYLRLSAILQLAAFGLFMGVYFVQPTLTDPISLADPRNHWILAASPTYWFLGLFNQLNGSLPAQLTWLAERAWVALGIAVLGAGSSLLLCYVHTMKKTVEEPDLVPGSGGHRRWIPSVGNSLQNAVARFSIRSLTRSRQHRVAFAFYVAFVVGLAFSLVRSEMTAGGQMVQVGMDFLISTFLMMFFMVVGFRSVFALPISLTANWVLRTTQLKPTEDYVAATRRTLLVLAVAPVWLLCAALACRMSPAIEAMGHLAVLALLGYVLVEVSLINFYKVPFTCSYLPGKANFQLTFWGFFIVLISVVVPSAGFELRALHDADRYGFLVCLLLGVSGALYALNHHRAKSAVLYFEELPEEPITTLKLSA
ncbi:MAG: hypothetical protein ABSF17_18905 [Terracidiphilus sp.]|jgi:hypothetical protein